MIEKPGLDPFRNIELYYPLLHCKKNGSDDRPVFRSMKTERIFQGMKRPERGADHSSGSNIEINNAWKRM